MGLYIDDNNSSIVIVSVVKNSNRKLSKVLIERWFKYREKGVEEEWRESDACIIEEKGMQQGVKEESRESDACIIEEKGIQPFR